MQAVKRVVEKVRPGHHEHHGETATGHHAGQPYAEKEYTNIPAQQQDVHPGVEDVMDPAPLYISDEYRGSGKLFGKQVLITGGDSGIGRSVAIHFAREGAAGVVIVYKGGPEDKDAMETVRLVAEEGAQCTALAADVGSPEACVKVIELAIKQLGSLDVLVLNAAEQHFTNSIADVTDEQLERTFRSNIFSMFYLTQAALPYLKSGASIITSSSVVSYKGEPELLDYSATKGAVTAFTRGLSQQLADKGIRVNSVAPGPIWTPLIPASFPKNKLSAWKQSAPIGRAGQPAEVAPSYVFLASDDSSYFSGQTLHPNGGHPVSA